MSDPKGEMSASGRRDGGDEQATPPAVTFEDVEAARERIADEIYVSPLAHSMRLSQMAGCRVSLKLENLQMTGSFKERGALNRLSQLDETKRAQGVVASSAGNHAQGVAYHASRLGIPATIVMPEGTPLVKISRTREFGAKTVLHGASFDEAYAYAIDLCEERGATFVHPFDDPAIIAGQGTIALEIVEQNPYIQDVIVPIGGGGLISGIAVALKEINPKIRVIGVEVEAYPSMWRAIRGEAEPEDAAPRRTIADGIAVKGVGKLTRDLVERFVDDIVLVSEEEVASAILLLLEVEKTMAEGGAAAAVAALVQGRVPGVAGRRVAAIISGGNIDVHQMSTIIERGLVKDGRMVRLQVTIPDIPGSLAHLLSEIAKAKANVLEVQHNRFFTAVPLGDTAVLLTLETRGAEHIAEIERQLTEAGYRVDS